MHVREVMVQMLREVPPLSIAEDWKIFLDWRFHAEYSGCVCCRNWYCFYAQLGDYGEQSDGEFDTPFGRHVEAAGGGGNEDPRPARGRQDPPAGHAGGWWEEVTFGVT